MSIKSRLAKLEAANSAKSGVADMSPSECMRISKYLYWLAGEVPMTPELQTLINELDAEYSQACGKTIREINAELEAECL